MQLFGARSQIAADWAKVAAESAVKVGVSVGADPVAAQWELSRGTHAPTRAAVIDVSLQAHALIGIAQGGSRCGTSTCSIHTL